MRIRPIGFMGAILAIGAIGLQQYVLAHVTMRASGPLSPSGTATISLVVPNERYVDTTRVVVEVPDDFLRSGGRITRIEYPADFKTRLEKEDIPADIYSKEAAARKARAARQTPAAESAQGAAPQAQQEQEMLEQMRRKWIKRVVFEEGTIPPDGFKEFRLTVQLPTTPGHYRFPAIQLYSDGKEVAWTQLVPGAERPAPELFVEERPRQAAAYIWPTGAIVVVLAVALALRRRKKAPARA